MMNGIAVIDRVTLDCIYSDFKRYPSKGEELFAEKFSFSLGGGACVLPIRLSKMGVPARLGTFLGDDILSDTVRKLLSEFGLSDVRNFYKGNDCPVIYSTIFSSSDDRGILSYDAGVDEIPDDELYEFFKGADICVAPNSEEVLKKLKNDGVKILCDSHWDEGQTIEDYIHIIKHADFFTPNDKEAMFLTHTETAEEALKALSEYTRNPIVKTVRTAVLRLSTAKLRAFRQ